MQPLTTLRILDVHGIAEAPGTTTAAAAEAPSGWRRGG